MTIDKKAASVLRGGPGWNNGLTFPTVGCRPDPLLCIALSDKRVASLAMKTYRVIVDGRTDFAVEATHEHGGNYTTGGFHTLLAADAWMANRIAVTLATASYRAKLLRDHGRDSRTLALLYHRVIAKHKRRALARCPHR
jgi:hypothetical protein